MDINMSSTGMQYRGGRSSSSSGGMPGLISADAFEGEGGSSSASADSHEQHDHPTSSAGTSASAAAAAAAAAAAGPKDPSLVGPSLTDSMHAEAQDRAERRRRRRRQKQDGNDGATASFANAPFRRRHRPQAAGTASTGTASNSTHDSGRIRRRNRRSYSRGGIVHALLNEDAVVRVMLVGLFLFLLCTAAMYRMMLSAGDGTDLVLTDEQLEAQEPRLRSGRDGESRSTKGGGEAPFEMHDHSNKKRKRKGLMQRVSSAGEWLSGGLFGGAGRGGRGGPKHALASPDSIQKVGDKTDRYFKLRLDIDEALPVDPERTKRRVQNELRTNTYEPIKPDQLPYHVFNCPLYPPDGYPYAWPVADVVGNWPPDDPTPRPKIHQGICVFDYETELEKAKIYREAEVPFVVRDDPEVLRTAERWNHPQYMSRLMDDTPHRTEYSPNNRFMYWIAENPKKAAKRRNKNKRQQSQHHKFPTPPEGWKPPTKMMRMPYAEWLSHANATEDKLANDQPHWYYRLIGCGEQGRCDKDSSEYLFDELPFFQPRRDLLYIVDPHKQKGIHCRFGMRGVIAENHFDGSRNAIVVLGGERRYILSHPEQCPNLALYPQSHPSARHSATDWAEPDLERFPEFAKARANEIVLQAGDVLYLPTNWFHFIISLTLNFQCNTRSGISQEYMQPMKDCGFFVPPA